MAVVAAGMHDPGILGRVEFTSRVLRNGQGINVRAEHQGLSRAFQASQGTNAASNIRKGFHGNSHLLQFLCQIVRRIPFFPPQFRVGMKIMALVQDIILFGQRQFLNIP